MLKSAYATIVSIIEHEFYPGGPKCMFFEGEWYDVLQQKCEATGLTLLATNPHNNFNLRCRFTWIQNCYTRPLAFWPYDPFDELPAEHPHKNCLVVIDRNQTEDA